ncbi:MAG TPA: periplasmic heavy metal sensor [Deferrisomatales bacterium]|nr:periplasmic heavy metal sensor [Deferrisomatales bacterium]
MKSRRPTRATVTTSLLGLALLSLAPLAAQARGGMGGPHRSPERAAQCLTGQLDLTEEQQEKVQAILGESLETRREMREEHRQQRDGLRAATEEQLAAVLTSEQMDELRELREDRWDRREDRQDRRGDRCRGCDQRQECRNGGGPVED